MPNFMLVSWGWSPINIWAASRDLSSNSPPLQSPKTQILPLQPGKSQSLGPRSLNCLMSPKASSPISFLASTSF